ncbi:MAG TPA: gamma-glutamyl-gamma-aminobutyrate hydrolase family protein [Nitrospirae bacterium]|nr:gamma-glutamyl-gamma-aminobutyrate hydrolase family protein [Nitrospirota bacterium]
MIGITGDVEKNRFSVKIVYAEAVARAGGYPVFLPPSSDRNAAKRLAGLIDALLISGGYDIAPAFYGEKRKASMRLISPERFHFERNILRAIMARKKPVLGVCYGVQFLNVALGGTLYQDLAKQKKDAISHRSGHKVEIYKGSKLYYILGKENIKVNSDHHQGIKKPGKGIIVSASSGDGLTEAIELEDYPCFIGVQWHPEMLSDRHSKKLFKSFVNAVRTGRDIRA